MKRMKKCVAAGLALAMVVAFVPVNGVQAAKPLKLNKSKANVLVGKTIKVSVKNAAKKAKVSWKSSKTKIAKIVSSTGKGNAYATVKGIKAGKATITAAVKIGKKTRKLNCKLTIKDKVITNNETATPIATAGVNPSVTTAVPTEVPTPTPVPTEVPTPSVVSETGSWEYIPVDDDSLLKEYGSIFGNVGTCLTYDVFNKKELQDPVTMAHVRKNYNSYTLENEMKPSYVLADPTTDFRNPKFNDLISRDEAERLGYTIPEGYSENVVPKLNFDRIDTILKVTKDNGLRMRGHTLIWHSQTPFNFFRVDYKDNGAFVSAEDMDQRIIYYITNVMKHIIENPNGDVVYTWDVVNEFYHQLSDGTGRNWSDIYDIEDSTGLITKPTYVKLAFKTAYDVLKEYGLQDKVPLFYNDYNTSQVADKIVAMVNYINAADELNPAGEKICAGVGMQCHLGLKWPSVEEQLGTVKKFIEAGFEVQITELDIVNDTNATDAEYCEYWFQFMKGLVQMRMSGAPITGVTFWGLSDAVTWRFGQSALLYGKDINDPKKALYAAYAAAQTSWKLK